ncbi:CLIP-associating protein 1-A-like isoform X2 [Brevipalpus obovatus]|uniref:CLIP-associating protein 1-A-like isoform X2 n=1 Tax=Brevipalpus obovatus TaxID=246614 RepID=UPI003D9F845D
MHHASKSSSSSDPAGAADEEMFIKSFEDVPIVHFSTTKELDEELSKIKEWLSEANNSDWQKRVNALKRLRGLMRTGGHEHKEFTDFLRFGELSFISCVKDLRSQVVRESCLTIAYISLKLGVKSGRFCETLLQMLINLIPNSAKIMSSSATVAIRFIIANTRLSRLIPIITYNITSKSREIRKACCEFLDQMLHTWSTATLEKHAAGLQDAIKKGISDADPEARQFARKAFWGFADHFGERADQLLQSLDPSKQRILHGEQFSSQNSVSNGANHRLLNYHTAGTSQLDGPSSLSSTPRVSSSSSSSSSQSRNPHLTNNTVTTTGTRRVNQSVVGSTSNKSLGARSSSSLSNGSSSVRSNIPKYGTSTTPRLNNGLTRSIPNSTPLRSTSAIDPDSARRARTRITHNGITDVLSKSNPKKATPVTSISNASSKESLRTPCDTHRVSTRITTRPSRTSQSQPGSRSTSPISARNHIGLASYDMNGCNGSTNALPRRRSSGIPRALSREASPSRSSDRNGPSSIDCVKTVSDKQKNQAASTIPDDNRPSFKNFLSDEPQKKVNTNVQSISERLLQQSREAEALMNDGLSIGISAVPRHRVDDHSDESDASSACSDICSLPVRNIEDISDIIRNLSSAKWMDRKEGLLDLLSFIQLSPRILNYSELKKVAESISKMLLDPQVKNIALLYKALNTFVNTYHNDLSDHLHLFLGKLFIKIGQSPLSSTLTKVKKSLDVIYAASPTDQQLNALIRFLSDQSSTLGEKSRIAAMQYLLRLSSKMNSADCYAPNKHELQLALMKMISWISDSKSQELRRTTKEALVALFNANRQRIYLALFALPKVYQDSALQLINAERHQNDNKSSYNSPHISPKSHQNSDMFRSLNVQNGSSIDNAENLNPEDIYTSLLQTTNEIQRYKFDSELDKITASLRASLRKSSTNSTSPASTLNTPKESMPKVAKKTFEETHLLSDKQAMITTLPNNQNKTTTNRIDSIDSKSSTPSSILKSSPLYQRPSLTRVKSVLSPITVPVNGQLNEKVKTDAASLITRLKNGLGDPISQENALNELEDIIKQSEINCSMYFKDILKILTDKMTPGNKPVVKQSALRILRELIQKQPSYFGDYIELTVLNILNASKDPDREVQRVAELAAATAAIDLPADQCLKILKSAINSEDPSMSQSAIKMMSKLVERQDGIMIEFLLPEIMPPLIKACDNPESSVRKSAIFTLVEIYKRTGDRMDPYLASMNGSKLKLLHLYIDKAKSPSHDGSDSSISYSLTSLN